MIAYTRRNPECQPRIAMKLNLRTFFLRKSLESTVWTRMPIYSHTSTPGRFYVDYLGFAFAFTKKQAPSLLALVEANACVVKRNLDACQLFTVVAIISDFNVVPMAYIYISENESETWTRAWGFARKEFSNLGRLTTVVSEADKGIVAGLRNIFTVSTKPFHVA